MTTGLLRAAGDYVREHGACTVEGYPVDAGIVSAFPQVGFVEVARPPQRRPNPRCVVQE